MISEAANEMENWMEGDISTEQSSPMSPVWSSDDSVEMLGPQRLASQPDLGTFKPFLTFE